MSVGGHFWTLWRRFRGAAVDEADLGSRPWQTTVHDPRLGAVRLTGASSAGDPGTLLLLIHGLGGCIDSTYMRRTAATARAAGLSVLRLNLRGADRRGEDFYHAGLTEDLTAAVASPELAGCRRIVALGFSLGGHLVLRWAAEAGEPRLAAIAAICPPLDLAAGSREIDRPARWPYRAYLLRHLKQIYSAVARRRQPPAPLDRALRVSSLRQWDEEIVAPRFGFADAADYYRKMSAGPLVGRIRVPGLIVASEADPLVPARSLHPFLDRAPSCLDVRWPARGGHVGFPAGLDLGFDGGPGLENQLIGWVKAQFAGHAV